MGTACDALIALDGGPGTMQEVAVASERGVPAVQVDTDRWPLPRISYSEVQSWASKVTSK
jgi:hypothetical protein